ncbi:hypothetical protein TVAG_392120 [Trichomonas vaginalis G3]|uniref:DUF3447 domain-containing protein n=1 Tax=Trichomonas vaginalis (strain ATCC PRA-98 / G3) TaxID=412133 RepID=A2DWR3_TRIV3|nr:spectrin binding [Trichomonas vaginalis G3]EAY15095.1 hypothetical protein TVAG_392120 [Trichomonas vaginalis G3]KAI5499223.1 spectrin binding [Trichomonas vaginalis G3]|eukprot:XP_001327318.1 hypothetical protein [Trichomonas vaginalis G3]
MGDTYLKQYEDFINTYEKLYHIKSFEAMQEVLVLIQNILIAKYKIHITDLIMSIFTAIKYNYRSIHLYTFIVNEILASNPVSEANAVPLFAKVDTYNLHVNAYVNDLYEVEIDSDTFPDEDSVQYMILYDQIDKFKEYITQNSLDKVVLYVPSYPFFSPLETCAYFGAVNIFSFLHSSLNHEISEDCLELSFIGGNTDIINECMKSHKLNRGCLTYIVSSHNNAFLDYVFEHELFKPKDFDYDFIINSQNLKALLLMYNLEKNSIIPWCAAFQQSLDIIKSGDLDLTRLAWDDSSLLHYCAIYDNVGVCEYLLNNSKIDINSKDMEQNTPLHQAVTWDHKNIIELIWMNINR